MEEGGGKWRKVEEGGGRWKVSYKVKLGEKVNAPGPTSLCALLYPPWHTWWPIMVHRAQIAVLIMNAAMGLAPPRKPRLRKPNTGVANITARPP